MNKYCILLKTMASAIVCLFLVYDIAWAYPGVGQDIKKTTLARWLVTRSLMEPGVKDPVEVDLEVKAGMEYIAKGWEVHTVNAVLTEAASKINGKPQIEFLSYVTADNGVITARFCFARNPKEIFEVSRDANGRIGPRKNITDPAEMARIYEARRNGTGVLKAWEGVQFSSATEALEKGYDEVERSALEENARKLRDAVKSINDIAVSAEFGSEGASAALPVKEALEALAEMADAFDRQIRDVVTERRMRPKPKYAEYLFKKTGHADDSRFVKEMLALLAKDQAHYYKRVVAQLKERADQKSEGAGGEVVTGSRSFGDEFTGNAIGLWQALNKSAEGRPEAAAHRKRVEALLRSDPANCTVSYSTGSAMDGEVEKIRQKIEAVSGKKIDADSIFTVIVTVALLGENVKNHAGNIGMLFASFDRDTGRLHIAVMDTGRGFPVYDNGVVRIHRRKDGGFEQDPSNHPGHDVGLKWIYSHVDSLSIYSQGYVWQNDTDDVAPEEKLKELKGAMVLAAIDLKFTGEPAEINEYSVTASLPASQSGTGTFTYNAGSEPGHNEKSADAIRSPAADPGRVEKKLLTENANEKNLLIKSAEYLGSTPVNEHIDVSAIPKDAGQLAQNMKTIARLIAWNNTFGFNIRYIFDNDPDGRAREIVKWELTGGSVGTIPGVDSGELLSRLEAPHAGDDAVNIYLSAVDTIKTIRSLSDSEYVVALKDDPQLSGIPIPNYTAASTIGLSLAALRAAKGKEGADGYERLRRKIFGMISNVYKRLGIIKDNREFTIDDLEFMSAGCSRNKLDYAIRYALPPVIKDLADRILKCHEMIRLVLQAA